MGADYYDRLHYLMSDFSVCVLNTAREAIIPHLEHVNFLVLDELHTYRGRQGADVAMLARRLQSRPGSANS